MGDRDYRNRVQFCDTILALRPLMNEHRIDLSSLLLHTDEFTFTKNGMFNQKNYVSWHDENPR